MTTSYPTTVETTATAPDIPPWDSDGTLAALRTWGPWATAAILALQAKAGADSSAVAGSLDYKTQAARQKMTLTSEAFDLDNGAGTTVDRVIGRMPFAITIAAARIVYEGATTGTVGAGGIVVGITVGGAELVASTAYENAKAVGTATALTLVTGAVAAGVPICVRHTGVGATQAGFAHVEIDFTID